MTQPAYPEIAEFWSELENGRLLLKRCNACGQIHYYPRAVCPFCLSGNTDWMTSTGRGRVYSYSVMRRVPQPYCLAMVELDEGVTLMTNIVASVLDDVRIGAEVQLHVTKVEGGGCIPTFKLADTTAIAAGINNKR